MAPPIPTPGNELAVIAPDERFGGGGHVQTSAFVDAATDLGFSPRVLSVRHPTFDGTRLTVDRAEAVRLVRGSRSLVDPARRASGLWVVSTGAAQGYAAALSARPYRCWLGTSLADEWRGRRPGLSLSRRAALELNAPFLRVLERRVLARAQRLYATSAWSRSAIAAAASVDEDAVGILPIPVDVERFRPLPEGEWTSAAEHPLLVFVGRADDPRKNAGLLLEAFGRLRRLRPEVRLVLVGTPPRTALPAGVESLGIVEDLPSLLRRATVFVLPSHQEGFGIVVAEALASGVPAVVTPSGGPESLVRESGGGVVLETFDADELSATLAALVGDVASLVEMRRRGRRHVENEHSHTRFRVLLADALRNDLS